MLCRTANELYWMARHIERAENTARLLDVTYRMSLLPYEAIEPGLAWAEPWAVPLITSGLATDFYERFPELSAENVLRFMILDASNPSSIYLLPARRARIGARGARRDHVRDVRGPELGVARDARPGLTSASRRWRVRVPRLGEDALAPVPRRDLRHDAARRGLPLHPARHAHRARRQHGAHPRRQVPHPAAVGGGRRRCRRLLPVGRAAALGVGLRVVPQDLQRRHHAAARRRAAHPARGHAAIAALVHEFHPRDARACCATTARRRSSAPAGELHARLHYGRTDDIIELGLARVPDGVPGPHLGRWATKSTSTSSFRRTDSSVAAPSQNCSSS